MRSSDWSSDVCSSDRDRHGALALGKPSDDGLSAADLHQPAPLLARVRSRRVRRAMREGERGRMKTPRAGGTGRGIGTRGSVEIPESTRYRCPSQAPLTDELAIAKQRAHAKRATLRRDIIATASTAKIGRDTD